MRKLSKTVRRLQILSKTGSWGEMIREKDLFELVMIFEGDGAEKDTH